MKGEFMANEEPKAIELDQFVQAAMQIILHAGDARNYATDSMNALMNGDDDKADELLKKAKEEITEAHKNQTDLLQEEMRYEGTGKESQVPLLFIHAQDTIMTIMTEVNLIEKMEKMYTKLDSEKK